MMQLRRLAVFSAFCGVLALLVASVALQAYVAYGPKWPVRQVPYYINPVNADMSETDAIASIQAGAMAWSSQSNADFSFYYMGRTSGSTLQKNGKNEMFFRNTSNGSVIAETYWWYDGNGRLVDADIVYYDGGMKFFPSWAACSGGIYLEDNTAHEFGHALGLGHSAVSPATMYASTSWCSTRERTLDPDDMAGIEALYPASGTNTAPSVSIAAPTNNSTVTQGTSIGFAGSAIDSQDGNISSWIKWTSSVDGQIGTGASFTRSLSTGTHAITATVTDSGGLAASTKISVTVSGSSSTLVLSGTGVKVKGWPYADLKWTGATSSQVAIRRNGTEVAVVSNTGAYRDSINRKGGGSYTYTLCEVGTTVCSNSVTVTF